jgi:[histone H3]-lysine36 N-dimethyltransferase SETMAR
MEMSLQVHSLEKIEYRSAIRFCVLLGQTNQEIMANLNRAYGEKCPSQSTIKFWIAEFKRGRQSVSDEEREGRPTTSRNEDVKEKLEKMVLEDRRITTRQLEESLQISHGTVVQLLKDLNFNKVVSRFVPRFLTTEMCNNRKNACLMNLAIYRKYGERFIQNILTVDETPLPLHQPESKRESMEWRKPEEGKVWKSRSGMSHRRELMLTVFWSHKGVILTDFLEKGRTISGEYYGNLVEQARRKCRKPYGLPHWFQHDNAPVHTSRIAQGKLNDCGFEIISHPPYSPDLAPSDYCLFTELKKQLRGQYFMDAGDLEEAVNRIFDQLPPSFYHGAFEALPGRWQKCVDAGGNWFEK